MAMFSRSGYIMFLSLQKIMLVVVLLRKTFKAGRQFSNVQKGLGKSDCLRGGRSTDGKEIHCLKKKGTAER